MVGTVDAKLDGKGVTYAHTILAVEHEGNAASNICVKGKRNQVEHGTVVFARVAFGMSIEVDVALVLFLQRNVDPLLRSDETFLNFAE